MADVPAGLKYTKEHEWIKVEGNTATVGITDHAQGALGDIVFVELPKEGDDLEAMKTFGVIESVKAAEDLYSPLTGKVAAINENLEASPESINKSPYEDGWIIKIEMTNTGELDQLMDAAAYEKLIAEA